MFFDQIPEGKPDPIFGLAGAFQADSRANKINLLVGVYKDEQLAASLMPSVRTAKELIQDDLADYLPIEGLGALVEALGPLIFGGKEWTNGRSRMFGAHTPGGTGALRVAAEFLGSMVSRRAYISHPTWPNHRNIFERASFQVDTYPYYSKEKKGFDFEAMKQSLEAMPSKSVVVLHASCHNPTGCDPTLEEWKALSEIMSRKQLLPLFDCAYQGFGEGLEPDVAAIRLFYEQGHEFAVAYSCSKNFSLYCQRVGALYFISQRAAETKCVGSQVKNFIRALYSNPPAHGARIVVEVLKQPALRKQWEEELLNMRKRMASARAGLIDRLMNRSKRVDFQYLQKHKGMFSFIDINKSQVQKLIESYGIYLTDNGRISVAGLTPKNIDRVVDGVLAVSDS